LPNLDVFALMIAALGQIGLCATILLARAGQSQVYMPLSAFFIALGVVILDPAVAVFAPALRTQAIALTLPAYLLLGPMLWLYVEGLTASVPWQWQRRHLWHFLPSALGLIVAGMLIALPLDIREQMLLTGELSPGGLVATIVLSAFALILFWPVQAGWYGIRAIRRLRTYRHELRNLFASNESRELYWLSWLVLVLGGVWWLAFAAIIAENFFGQVMIDRRAGAGMALLLTWTLAVWGLRQKPGFEGRYLDDDSDEVPEETTDITSSQKYQRSALGEEQSVRIAAKIDAAMKSDQLFLDPALSLHKLARHVAIPPSYISQTLNETIGKSFFDYVNQMRIEHAKPLIIEGKETILAISLRAGFNARSSFYKAFKLETGQTPSAFRNAYQSARKAVEKPIQE
jgi:AraC-like DNA-binding protein